MLSWRNNLVRFVIFIQLLLLFLFLDVNVQLVQRPVEVLKSVILDALKLGATQ